MSPSRLNAIAVVILGLIMSACGGSGGGSGGTVTAAPSLSIQAPNMVFLGTPVTFALTGSAGTRAVSGSRIDVDADNVFDQTASHTTPTATYSHTYTTPGNYPVRAELLEGTQVIASATTNVVVTDMPVSLAVDSVTPADVGVDITCSNFTVNDWMATLRNMPMDVSITDIPETRINLNSMTISYAWNNAMLSTPDRVVSIAGQLAINATLSVTFSPIEAGQLGADKLGESATLSLTFEGVTGGGEAVQISATDTLNVASCNPLTAPTGLNATATGTQSVSLSWSYAGSGGVMFSVERRPSGSGLFSVIGSTASTSFNNATGLTSDTSYQYRVRTTAGSQQSNYSNTTQATTLISFAGDVYPMFGVAPSNCNGCHSGSPSCPVNGGLPLDSGVSATYTAIRSGAPCDNSQGTARVELPPALVRTSQMLTKPTQDGIGHLGGVPWTVGDNEYLMMERWITQGALNN